MGQPQSPVPVPHAELHKVESSWKYGCRSAGRTSDILGRLQRRRAAAGAQAVARERKVSLMRKYRTGELPDVQQLSIAAFLAPLGDPSMHLSAVQPHMCTPWGMCLTCT